MVFPVWVLRNLEKQIKKERSLDDGFRFSWPEYSHMICLNRLVVVVSNGNPIGYNGNLSIQLTIEKKKNFASRILHRFNMESE